MTVLPTHAGTDNFLSTVEPVAEVSQSGQDKFPGVEFAVQGGGVNFDSRIKSFDRADTFGRANYTNETHIFKPGPP